MSFVDLFREQPGISHLTGFGRKLAWSTRKQLPSGAWEHAIVTYDGRNKRTRSIGGATAPYALTAFEDELLWLEQRDGHTNVQAMPWSGEEVRRVARAPQPDEVRISQACGRGAHLVLVGETPKGTSVVLAVERQTGEVRPVVSADFQIQHAALSGPRVVLTPRQRAQLHVVMYDGAPDVRTIQTGDYVQALASAGEFVVLARRDGTLARVDLAHGKLHTFATLEADLDVAALQVTEPYVFVRTGPGRTMTDGLQTRGGPAILRVSLVDGSCEPLLAHAAPLSATSGSSAASGELSGPHVAEGSMYFASRSRGAVSKVSFAS